MALPRYAAYCTCGASLTLRDVASSLWPNVLVLFWQWHAGVGHGAPPAAGAGRTPA